MNPWVVVGHPDVSVQSRDFEEESYYFVMNFSEETQIIEVAEESTDLLTGEKISKHIQLQPYGVKVLHP